MSVEKRAYPRVKVHTPVEILQEATEAPIRGETSDLSLGGCYVGMMFPLPIGTPVEVRLRADDITIIVLGVIATCDPQVGNGIQFLRMLPEDRHDLKMFIEAAAEDSSSTDFASVELVAVENRLSH
ncbi:MAG TPA: PilZ domain-containing protein [Terriglobales bacterium]|nr:PilZ domain-containing protein [Terriglobales bacterium]